MLVFVTLILAVLALGPQVALGAFKFSFSEVMQCGPLSISFNGNETALGSLPMILTLIPFNSQPVSIPIPNFTTTSTGVNVTFLPFAAGTTFVVSLDHTESQGIGRVSDVIKVLPSSTGDSACLPNTNVNDHRYSLKGTLSQCSPFNVTFNPAVVKGPPSIRAFIPLHSSFLINRTDDVGLNDTATYILDAKRGSQVVFLLDDGSNYQQTSDLITVGGDTSSNTSCLPFFRFNSTEQSQMMSVESTPQGNLSKTAIVGVSIGAGSFFGLLIILTWIFVCRGRRKRRFGLPLPDSLLEQGGGKKSFSARTPFPFFAATRSNATMIPGYTSEKLVTPDTTASAYTRDSMMSWQQIIPEDQRYPALPSTRIKQFKFPALRDDENNDSSRSSSMSSLNMEHILDLATIYDDESGFLPARPPSTPIPETPIYIVDDLPVIPPVTAYLPSRGHLHKPSDVPTDSSLSVSMFQIFPYERNSVQVRHFARLRTSAAESDRISYVSDTHNTMFLHSPSDLLIFLPTSPKEPARQFPPRVSSRYPLHKDVEVMAGSPYLGAETSLTNKVIGLN